MTQAIETFSFMDLLEATSGDGWLRFAVKDGAVKRACLACDSEFEQTDDGLAELKAHQMEHGAATTCDLSEVNGKSLRMVVIVTPCEYGGDDSYEVWGVDDERGVVYYLSNAYTRETCWKWKLTKQTKPDDGPKVMQLAAASLLNG
jgi:hypothetical protein